MYLADQKIPLAVPRVRDRLRNQEVPLPTYERLQAPRTLDAGLLHKVLGGLSTREYERCAETPYVAIALAAWSALDGVLFVLTQTFEQLADTFVLTHLDLVV